MIDARFDIGKAYVGTATLDSKRKKVFQIVARRGGVVSLVAVKGVRREMVDECDGTEFVKTKDADGFEYFVSSSVAVDVDAAFAIVGMCG